MAGKMRIVPDDERRSPEIAAEIRKLEAQKMALVRKGNDNYRLEKKTLNIEIYRLSKIGIPQDLSWRNNDGRPRFLPVDQTIHCVRLKPDQVEFCSLMTGGNVSEGVRACIDFTMASRELPKLPAGLED